MVDGWNPQGRVVENKYGARAADIVSLKGGGEAVVCWWAREWDEVRTHRGALRLLTMTDQSTDGAVWCQAALDPYWRGIYILKYINTGKHTRRAGQEERAQSGRWLTVTGRRQ